MRRAMLMAAAAAAVVGAAVGAAPGASAPRCPTGEPAADDGSFAFLTGPGVGTAVRSGFTASGCSRTFESTVVWRLRDRAGRFLARGTTQGGGAGGAKAFSFTVRFSVRAAQVGRLEVDASDPSAGEGGPPVRNLIPLVLKPG